jgi:hypothetical protein
VYCVITAKALAVLEALLWAFLNAKGGLCFPNGRQRTASSAEIARRLKRPPLGFLRASRLACVTGFGRASTWLLRPSTFSPVAMRLSAVRRRCLALGRI